MTHKSIMKLKNHTRAAFTIIELLVVITLITFLAAMLLPALARTKAASLRINCTDNLKRIGLAFQSFGSSHSDRYPTHLPVSSGGYADYLGQRVLSSSQATSRGVFADFMVMSNDLSSPHLLVCPAENEGRTPATTFSGVIQAGSTNQVAFINDLNVSYFVGVDATLLTPAMFLAGDHNLGSDGNLVPLVGFVTTPLVYRPDFKITAGTSFTTNAGIGWLDTMHSKRGNVVMGDCSVQQLDRVRLQASLARSGDTGGAITGPNFTQAPGCSGFANRLQFP